MSRRSSVAGDQQRVRSLGKGRKSEPLAQHRPEDVACDMCVGMKRRAAKSCLSCLASFCEAHLQPHYESPVLMKHKLVAAAGQLQEKICTHHDKLREVFCRTDQQCICLLCMMEEHKTHETVSAAAERTEKQKQLAATLMRSQSKIQGRVKKWQNLQQAVEALRHSAQTAMEENERIFSELVRAIERRHAEVRELIRAQEKAVVTRAVGVLDQLEREIAELRRRHAELEQLAHTDDHIHFIQSWQSLSAPSGYEDVSNITVNSLSSFGPTRKAISELKERLADTCKGELLKISAAVKEVDILQAQEPQTREDFLQYACQLTMDPATAHSNLHVTEEGTRVRMVSDPRPCSESPDRFENWQQVLCREGLSGARCYWEVELRASEADVAISYRGISRKGVSNECSFGWNDRSWSLYCSDSKCSFVHNNSSTAVPLPGSSRIGVYLDHGAGVLAFYAVSDTMTLLHRLQTMFTEPVYPGFGVWGYGSTLKLL
ncbi:tripartite motif-containing protein 16 [Megalops cyprinoides]|uniref:tripartite motif-containing protein 16 n=1 Tax=Megalops cyprinoides TaxID=118141 RepID=UPI001864A2BE|nr:tripartite motif-containing protein 16 [Megalops cyprinoides]